MKPKRISAAEFDRLFDEGKESILPYLDFSKARRPNLEVKRVNVDLPRWMINALDREAARLGITRQSVIKTWLGEKIAEKTGRDADQKPHGRVIRQVAEPQRRYRAKTPRR